MNFASDNVTGVHPEVMAALQHANETTAMMPYGGDEITARLAGKFGELFETEVQVFPVATGTAANSISIAAMSPPWGAVYCLEHSHTNADEGGAPEFYTGGAKLVPIEDVNGKMTAAALDQKLASRGPAGDPHAIPAAAVSITQLSEAGTAYSPDEIAAVGEVARKWGLKMHLDGARFANAVAAGNAAPADHTWRSGVDIMSFGATKNGALAAEAVVVFDPELAETIGRRRMRGGHLFSKMRFASAQLEAMITDDLWLRNARHANEQAKPLAAALAAHPEVTVHNRVDANEIFATAPKALWDRLMEAGFFFYTWQGAGGDETALDARIVTAFNTEPAHVDKFVAVLGTG